MTSKIVVNNIEADSGISTVSFAGDISVSGSAGALSATSVTSSGAVTAGSITVGNTIITSTSIGIGTTTTAGRNAGVGTAAGNLIFNTTTKQLEVFSGDVWVVGAREAFIASGGTEVESGATKYHVFTTDGTFSVTQGSVDNAEVLVVGGGGGGSDGFGSAGGEIGRAHV